MLELYDRFGHKIAEIRDRRLVSMVGDCLALFDEPPSALGRAHLYADMACRHAWLIDGYLLDDQGATLACTSGRTGRLRRWHDTTLPDWAYGASSRAPDAPQQPA